MVQPVTHQQVEHYLEQAGEQLVGLRGALRSDQKLWELFDTPLMMSIAALAYQGTSAADILSSGTANQQRRQLFDTYIATMFKRRGASTRYSQQQTTHWLSWLAHQMVEHNQTAYYIEGMQPSWLRLQQHSYYGLYIQLLFGLVFGLLSGLLIRTLWEQFFIQLFDPIFGSIFGLAFAILVGMMVGLGFGLAVGPFNRRDIVIVETLRLSWSKMRGNLLIGLAIGLVSWAIIKLTLGLIIGLIGGLIYWLVSGLLGDKTATRSTPNQSIRRSFRSCLVVGLASALGFALVVGLILTLIVGLSALTVALDKTALGVLVALLMIALGLGLVYGGRAFLQHYTIRWLFAHDGLIPFRDRNLIPFPRLLC